MKAIDWQQAKKSLDHILWIGGASSAGKTTVSTRIAEEFGFIRYDGDGHALEHATKATRDESPNMYRFGDRMRNEQPGWFMSMDPEEFATMTQAAYPEDFSMVVEDLLAMGSGKRIVVDLCMGYPIRELIEVADMRRLIFLVATPEFQRGDYERTHRESKKREKLAEHFANPDQMMSNYVEGHVMLSRYVREKCEDDNLPFLVTGGNMSVDEVYAAVCEHLGLGAVSKPT